MVGKSFSFKNSNDTNKEIYEMFLTIYKWVMHDLFSELYFQLITRVKAQEKKVDHLEHAKRKEEHGMK